MRWKYQTTEWRMVEANVWSWFHAAREESLPFHFMRVRASSQSRTPLSSPMNAWKTLKVEQGGRRGSFRASLKAVKALENIHKIGSLDGF